MTYRSCLASICFVVAASACGQDVPEPRVVLKKAIAAHGGESNISKPRMGVLKGTTKDDLEATQEETFDLPKRWKRVTVLTINGRKRVGFSLVNDGRYWEWEEGREPEETKNVRGAAPYFGVLTRLIELTGENVKLSRPAEIKVDGRAAVGFRATWDDDQTANYYFDKTTGLLVQTTFKWGPEPGKELDTKIVLADYKEVDGVKLPHRRTFYAKPGDAGGFLLVPDFVVTEVKIGNVPNAVFSLPGKE